LPRVSPLNNRVIRVGTPEANCGELGIVFGPNDNLIIQSSAEITIRAAVAGESERGNRKNARKENLGFDVAAEAAERDARGF